MKKIIFIIVLFLVLLSVFLTFFFNQDKRSFFPTFGPTPTPAGAPRVEFGKIDYKDIFSDPEIATSVQQSLQNPLYASREGELTIVSFPTDTNGRPNKVYEKDNKASIVLQEVTKDNNELTTFINAHPNSKSFVLYDYLASGAGFDWYIFPQEGMAFLANKEYGYAIRVLYFPKTSQEEFIQTTAKTLNLQSVSPEEKQESAE